ncbi:MAG: hypothetical protein RI909_1812 [Bacteroidota bacterium]|jgi:Leucine-rich repeat (LRR) protein
MKQTNRWLIVLFLFFSLAAVAQKKTTKKPVTKKDPVIKTVQEKKPDLVVDEKKVRDMIAFLEFMLNTLGNSSTPVRDKEVLITESYAKIFRDSKVQVEDDLDADRKVITNKDVVAYLKDVNFFFHDVRFEFAIEDIKGSSLPGGNYFYKVTTSRNLKGTTADQKKVNTTQPRFIEINYNPKDQDLKIVSMYTNEFDDKQALAHWWKELSYEWQSVFTEKLNLKDSVQLSDIKNIIALEELDLSHNPYIQTIEPLSPLINLHSLDLTGTQINDLTPIRNLTDLVSLRISNTKVSDLSPLKYSNKLEELILKRTEVVDIAMIKKMPGLKTLDLSDNAIADFSAIATLTQLQHVDLRNTSFSTLTVMEAATALTSLTISRTRVQDLSAIKSLTNLQTLNMDSTRVSNITPLSALENLEVLHANATALSNLSPLQKLPHLIKVYCDQTLINREIAEAFMIANPRVLVIFNSKDLRVWWDDLSEAWQQTFIKAARIGENLSKEELAKIPLLDSINLQGQSLMSSLEPLRKLQRLRVVIVNQTAIEDLSPLQGQKEIRHLDISETGVRDLSVINNFTSLKTVKANGSKIENIEKLVVPSLELFYADDTNVRDKAAQLFLKKNNSCTLIYKTDRLNTWWNSMPESWKSVLNEKMKNKSTATSEELHRLVEQETLQVKDAAIHDLVPLNEFIRLKDLHLSGTSLTTLTPVANLLALKSLHITNSPLQQLDSLDQLTELENLDLSNTPIEDVYLIWKLKSLKKLNVAGTQIKRLNALEKLEHLEHLDCSNTNVSKLDSLDYLPLKTLKCYNTKVSNRAIENFKASHADCQVIYY